MQLWCIVSLLQVFVTEERAEVERYLEKHADGFRWEEDGSCSVWNTRPATLKHPQTGELLQTLLLQQKLRTLSQRVFTPSRT